jgi:hypothetical protein
MTIRLFIINSTSNHLLMYVSQLLLTSIFSNCPGSDEQVHEAGNFLIILEFSFLFSPKHHADDRFPIKLQSNYL